MGLSGGFRMASLGVGHPEDALKTGLIGAPSCGLSSMAASVVRLTWQRRVLESMSQEPQAEAAKLSKNLTSTTF